jgi:hypothetical protein
MSARISQTSPRGDAFRVARIRTTSFQSRLSNNLKPRSLATPPWKILAYFPRQQRISSTKSSASVILGLIELVCPRAFNWQKKLKVAFTLIFLPQFFCQPS